MIKCIASDMDGTLLNSTAKKITNENRLAILAAQSQGIEFVITTGRAYEEVYDLLEESGLKCPVIAANGAETRARDGEIIAATPLNKREAMEAARTLLRREVYFEVYTDKGKFTKDREESISLILDIVMSANPRGDRNEALKYAKERAKKVHLTPDYKELFIDNYYRIYKLLAFSFDDKRLAAVKEELSMLEGIAVSSSGHENLEINDCMAQKGIALEKFVRNNNISLAETMAIGDSYNDLSMFKRAGRAVAMGNADEAIKAQADFVTATNNENGVAKAIWQVLKRG